MWHSDDYAGIIEFTQKYFTEYVIFVMNIHKLFDDGLVFTLIVCKCLYIKKDWLYFQLVVFSASKPGNKHWFSVNLNVNEIFACDACGKEAFCIRRQ